MYFNFFIFTVNTFVHCQNTDWEDCIIMIATMKRETNECVCVCTRFLRRLLLELLANTAVNNAVYICIILSTLLVVFDYIQF